jgi:hypothetical protein
MARRCVLVHVHGLTRMDLQEDSWLEAVLGPVAQLIIYGPACQVQRQCAVMGVVIEWHRAQG